jgi:poly-gamma-glutamate capsule biosynthesis protein CapA/YwtB (metallophosphatase superfamily)
MKEARRRRKIVLFLCGDVMTGRGIDQVLPFSSSPEIYEGWSTDAREYVELAEQANGPIPERVAYEYVWGRALEEPRLRAADFRIVNLETSVTTSDAHEDKGINYRMHPRNVRVLTVAGVDCCVLSNNHVLDWGEAGLLETLDTLHEAGIETAGAGRNAEEASAPARLWTRDGAQVLVYGLGTWSSGIPSEWAAASHTPGVNYLPDFSEETVRAFAERVKVERKPEDLVVVSIHWGGNWGYGIPEKHRRFAHALIDEVGADVVHGHSSHHAKAVEVYRDRPILYGCGDFINDYEGITGHEEYRDDLPLMYFPELDATEHALARLTLVPLHIEKFSLERASARDSRWLAEVLTSEGLSFGTRIEPKGGALELDWPGHRAA